MPRATQRTATLVVIEFGASWPGWFEPNENGDMAVVAQHYQGAPGSLVMQVGNRVARLESRGWRLDAMVLVSNGRTDPEDTAARAVLARGLLANLKRSGGGELVLTLDDHAPGRARHSLTALAAGLDQDAVGTNVIVGMRLGKAAPMLGLSAGNAKLAS
jgi:hypothetical protein